MAREEIGRTGGFAAIAARTMRSGGVRSGRRKVGIT
jgi:hypothetical protein